jgi:putative membrane protein
MMWIPILLVIWLIWDRDHRANGSFPVSTTRKDPLQIVKERYARGEITKEQYDQLKSDLQD